MAALDVASYSAFFVGFRKFARLPSLKSRRMSDFGGQHPVAEVGSQQAQPIELVRMRGGVVQRKQAAEGDSAQPDRYARRARRQHEGGPQPLRRAATTHLRQFPVPK